jgi:FtsP/CotA-like multicopper oxidase with cupredoxin domain
MLANNGSVPGPTLQVEQGRDHVHTRNDGDIATTVHWHCLRLEQRYDGVSARDPNSRSRSAAATAARCSFPDTGFHWYHPHIRGGPRLGDGASMEPIVVEPTDAAYWLDVDCQLTMSWTTCSSKEGASYRSTGRADRHGGGADKATICSFRVIPRLR